MEREQAVEILRHTFREQVCCLGRVFARHRVPDDAVWEAMKGLDVLYQRARRELGMTAALPAATETPDRLEPHPAVRYLLSRLQGEDDDSDRPVA